MWDVQEGRWTHAILVLDVKQDPRLQFIRAYVKLRVVVPDLCNENEMRIRLVMNDFNDAGGIDDRCEEWNVGVATVTISYWRWGLLSLNAA